MQTNALRFLRISLGGLMVYWGVDKLLNVAHGVTVAQKFYGGMTVGTSLMQGFGVLQVLLGLLIIAGVKPRLTYPALLAVTGTTLLAVWQSIIDPFKLFTTGGTLIFYPSLIIFAGAFVLYAFRDSTLTLATQASDASRTARS